MNKLKKITIAVIIAIIALASFCTTANAYYVGEIIGFSYNEYLENQNMFCVERHQRVESYNTYKIISQVRIEGKKSTDYTGKTQTSWHNAKLAYILNGNNYNGGEKVGPVTHAIWNHIHTWINQVGQYHEGIYTGFSNGVTGDSSYLDAESDNYANNLENAEENTIKDNTVKENIKVVSYEKDGASYIRVGPFNWTFAGKMASIAINDQNGNNIEGISYNIFDGNEAKECKVEDIKSETDFYISVPMSTDIIRLTKVTGKTTTTVKGANIWFLQSTQGYKQNMIIREPYEAPVETETPFDYDIPIQGHLKVIKVNQDNEEIKLKGVGFYIKHKNTDKYVHQDGEGNISYTEKEQATEFVTDEKGEFLIQNLLVGTYVAYETKNPNYGYEIITEGKEKDVTADKTSELKIGNKQIYVKLSGYVWLDKVGGKQPRRNDLYKEDSNEDENDVLFNGVTVRLKDRTTSETIMETVTSQLNRYKDSINDGNGEYLFVDVLVDKLKDYYIEFEYDGLVYANVVPNIEKDNGSKAAEADEERETFNNNFAVVEGETRNTGFTRDTNGNRKYELSYNVNETAHEAILIKNGQYTITSNTDVPNYRIRNHFTYGQEEIPYINLGLHEREQPDLAVTKDLENVRLTINGYEHTYNYSQRFSNIGEYGDGFNVGVKFGNKYSNVSYTRPIYKSDYDFINENDKSRELKTYVTYQIRMSNKSALTSQVNSLVDYYDSRYEIVNVGTSVDEKGNVVGNIDYTTTSYNNDYKKAIINNNTKLEGNHIDSIYVQFALNREAVLNVLNNKENLDNVVEINSYTTFNGNKIYAGVDRNSNPGNSIPGDTRTYEDDTDASPALKLEVADAREMTGTVFVDETNQEMKVGEIRQGNGVYDPNEKVIEGVDVTLAENTGSGKVYTTKTDENGNFFISGYIPGDYTVTFTWGDQTYTVQNYKGTIYDKNRDQNNKKWYKDQVENRLNDAMDNYVTRQEIDKELAKITNTTQTTKTKMDSSTPTMGIGVEYETTYTSSLGDKYTYRISNIDFGIVERARQDIGIQKRIKRFKVTLTNGQIVADATIDENGVLTGKIDNITYMKPDPNTNPSNGFIRLELDSEMMQGSTVEVEYGIKVTNKSELDYLSENYYKYGIIEGHEITIEPSGIIDYLDNSWSVDTDKNPLWQVKTEEEAKQLVSSIVFEHPESTVENKTILYTEGLKGQYLKPAQSAELDLNVSKILTSTDETSYDNEVEIAELNRTGGSKLPSIPGNYVPGTGANGNVESDDSMAETAIITSATGENRNYILPVILGITACAILGVGVVLIKRKI